jgi:NAD-dependent dihydropyrimidine dehydrogenase PreA subunit
MSIRNEQLFRVVLYEGTGSQPLPAEERLAALNALLNKGYSVTSVRPNGNVAPADGTALFVLGKFDELPVTTDTSVQFRQFSPDVVGTVESYRQEKQMPAPGTWKPWFPVIDFDRCTNCMQCLSFCLFGVYGVTPAGQITVQNEDNCKTNCPACSRVCPEVAIMFPKYAGGPINGDEVSQADAEREKVKVDVSALLGGDIYKALRERSVAAKSRFSKERDSDRALQERMKCLNKLQQQLDVPPEVLKSLPSPAEIQRRAEDAKRLAEEALARNAAK